MARLLRTHQPPDDSVIASDVSVIASVLSVIACVLSVIASLVSVIASLVSVIASVVSVIASVVAGVLAGSLSDESEPHAAIPKIKTADANVAASVLYTVVLLEVSGSGGSRIVPPHHGDREF
jgi:uncharacterized membrane protein